MADTEMTAMQATADAKTPPASGQAEFRPTRGGLKNVLAAYKHIRGATKAAAVKQRTFDHVTVGLVSLGLLCMAIAIWFDWGPIFRVLPLIVTNIILFVYLAHRMGIFLSVNARQAMIFWQVLLGAFWLGITCGLLVMTCSLFWTE